MEIAKFTIIMLIDMYIYMKETTLLWCVSYCVCVLVLALHDKVMYFEIYVI